MEGGVNFPCGGKLELVAIEDKTLVMTKGPSCFGENLRLTTEH